MIIALASPQPASSIDEGLEKMKSMQCEAASQGAAIVCFPEAYLPGLRGQDFDVPTFDHAQYERVIQASSQWARSYSIATIVGTERYTDDGRQIVSVLIDPQGRLQGIQTKNQIHPLEEQFYVPGTTRQLFEVHGIKFGVAICHEAWRYPETVRWAAIRGAKIVFQPQHTGYAQFNTENGGRCLTTWGATDAPYYEKAMLMRSIENSIYFASVNYALSFQESSTCVITPSGECQAFLAYGQEGILVQEIDIERATGLFASRFAPERYEQVRCN